MAVYTAKQLIDIKKCSPVFRKLRLDRVFANFDSTTGELLNSPVITGTDSSTFTIDLDSSAAKIAFDTNSATGDFTFTIKSVNIAANRTLYLPEAFTGTKYIAVTDNTDGSTSSTGATGTTNTTFEVDDGTTHTSLILSAATAGSTGKSTTLKAASAADDYTVTVPDPGGNSKYVAYTDQSDGTVVTTTSTGTSNASFEVDAGGANSRLILSAATGGASGNALTLIAPTALASDYTVTAPDPGGADSLVYLALAQTMTNKTLNAPTISSASFAGTLTITTPTVTGTWTDLGAVTTVDINGGTIDAATIGGATPGAITGTTIASTGTASLADAQIGGGYGSAGVTISDAGVIQANGAITTDGALTADSAAIGGGYGSTGATISTAGVGQFNGALTTDGALTADSAAIGGGYGSTGASISTAGVGQFNGALTTDGALTADNIVCTNAATFGGGYGSTGATISTAGIIQANGAITSDGAVTGGSLTDGTVTLTAGSVTGTWVDLGTVTTVDINGGTIDGVTIGAAAAPTVTDLGSVATCDINGGSVDGVTIGAASAGAGTFTALTISDATPDIEFKDLGAAAGDVNASIVVNAIDTGDGTEDVDVVFNQQIAGNLTAFLTADADGNIILGSQRSVEAPQATNSAILAFADQSNQDNTYTFGDADGDKYVAYSSQADGTVAEADLKASLADKVAYVATSFNDEADGSGTLTIQATDAAGNSLSETISVEVWIGTAQDYGEDAASTDFSVSTGTEREEITADAAYRVVSDSTGTIVMEFDNGGAGTYYAWVEFAGKVVEQTMTVTV